MYFVRRILQKKSTPRDSIQYFYPVSASPTITPIMPISRHYESVSLGRTVHCDFYMPSLPLPDRCPVLLVNDGQDLPAMPFPPLIHSLWAEQVIIPLLIVAIHAGSERRMEYGVAGTPDYLGRGGRANLYQTFVLHELLPAIRKEFPQTNEGELAIAGFSLGGLSAMDLAWQHPKLFHAAGIFSGSFWWRSLAQEDPLYSDAKHRIMHDYVRKGEQRSHQRFFFQCGALDEKSDRNRNGVIDSIDDTLDLIDELVRKGISRGNNIYYLELADGSHDIPSWSRAFPFFLRWNYGK